MRLALSVTRTFRMSRFRNNVLANYAGRSWSGLLSLIFIPVYIRLMGIEAYGLVGFFITLQAVFSLLDMGLSTALNRELARATAASGKARQAKVLVRTLETVYALVGAAIALLVLLLAPLIAGYWIQNEQLPTSTVTTALQLMGLTLALQWPFALYAGGLMGLQRQVRLNVLTIAMGTLRWGGAALVLAFVVPTIEAFFVWQALVSAVQTLVTRLVLRKALPTDSLPARFDASVLSQVWRFAAGMTGISVLSVVLTQMDKIILSRLLPLEMFGYYALAAVVASTLYVLVTPIFTAAFPRFSQLVAHRDVTGLKEQYHRTCQLMSLVVLPAALVIALFSEEILLIWTGDAVTTAQAHTLVSMLVIGTALNALVNVPYALQLAYGWTRFALISNAIAVTLLAPAIVWAATHYGAHGAALAWVVLNCGYVFIAMPIMHRWLLEGELTRWYLADVGLPLLGCLTIALLGRWWFPAHAPTFTMIIWLVLISTLAFLGAASTALLLRKRHSLAY
jgi:O-antigen/teichoic acid export membrane protein